jgi:hypothetical protein
LVAVFCMDNLSPPHPMLWVFELLSENSYLGIILVYLFFLEHTAELPVISLIEEMKVYKKKIPTYTHHTKASVDLRHL